MKTTLIATVGIYVAGFCLMLLLCTQLPNTFGLALVRSAVWPVSVLRHEIWPRGEPLPMD